MSPAYPPSGQSVVSTAPATGRVSPNPTFDQIAANTMQVAGQSSVGTLYIAGVPGLTSPMEIFGKTEVVGAPTTGNFPSGAAVYDLNRDLHFCYVGGNPGVWDTTTVPAPTVTGQSSTPPTQTSVTLSATINTQGVGPLGGQNAGTYYFQIGTTSGGPYTITAPVPAAQAPVDAADHVVSQAFTGLTANTTYYWQCVCATAGGTVAGTEQSFQTLAAVAPPTLGAVTFDQKTQTSVRVLFTIVPNNQSTTWQIDYGLTTGYGTTVGPTAAGSDGTTHSFAIVVSGLTANTLYNFKVTAVNASGSVNSGNTTVTTLTNPQPTVTTNAAGTPTNNSCALNGTMNANGVAGDSYYFEIGLSTTYGTKIPTSPASFAFSDSSNHAVTQSATGLAASTLYHSRLVGVGPSGTLNPGADVTFTTASDASVNNVAKWTRFCYGNPQSTTPNIQNPSRYTSYTLQDAGTSTNQARIAYLKAGNPNMKVYFYSDFVLGRTGDVATDPNAGGITGCLPWSTLNATEAWFLHDANGARIPDKAYPGSWVMDCQNASLISQGCANMINRATLSGFDGVWLDDLTANIYWAIGTAATDPKCPQYPTDVSYQTAITNMLATAYTNIHNAGFLLGGNVGGTWAYPGTAGQPMPFWTACGAHMDLMMEESLAITSAGQSGSVSYVPRQLLNLDWAETNGKHVQCVTLSTTEAGQTYGLAAMLLCANGMCEKSTNNNSANANETWYGSPGSGTGGEYDAALRLGAPLGARTSIGNNAWQRLFANGNVKLNASAVTVASVPALTGQINA
jgi:hypothetical protein